MMKSAPETGRGPRSKLLLMAGVLVLSFVLLAAKTLAWRLTGSQALFSDAAESIVNVVTGAFGLFSIWLASQPPDEDHPYGHGKIEFFAAGLNGALILAASGGILREAIPGLWSAAPVFHLGAGLGLAGFAGVANAAAGLYLLRRGRESGNMTFVGEGKHLLADTVTTAGVVIALLLVRLTGWILLDPLIACAIGLYVGWSGLGLLREAASRLMDRADPSLLSTIARALERHHRSEWIEVHNLRAWMSGDLVHADFHVSVPRFLSFEEVHDTQVELESLLIQAIGRPGDVLVHSDPCRPALCPICTVAPCELRESDYDGRGVSWDLVSLAGKGPAITRPRDSRPS